MANAKPVTYLHLETANGNRQTRTALHTASPSEIWINQSALSRRQKLYCPDIITQT